MKINEERIDKYYKQIGRSRILEKQNTKDILNDLIKLNKEGKYKEAFIRYMYLHIKDFKLIDKGEFEDYKVGRNEYKRKCQPDFFEVDIDKLKKDLNDDEFFEKYMNM